MRSLSSLRHKRGLLTPLALHSWTWTTIATRRLPSCVPPLLTYYRIGSRAPHRRSEDPPCFGRLASPGSARADSRRYGNINPLSIDYACRPRLRSRLTQGGLAWPWNPWSFGGRVSHPSFATHACILTRVASTAGFPRRLSLPRPPFSLGWRPRLGPPAASLATRRSPTHPQAWIHRRTGRPGTDVNDTASAVCLSPATLSARNHLTSELLRTL